MDFLIKAISIIGGTFLGIVVMKPVYNLYIKSRGVDVRSINGYIAFIGIFGIGVFTGNAIAAWISKQLLS